MATWRAIDSDTLRQLLTILHDTRWSWTADQVPQLAQRLGWDILETLDGKGAIGDSGWNVGDEEVEFAFSGEIVNDITMRLSDTLPTKQPNARAFAQDTFATAVAAATEILGPATTRTPGASPQARWRGEDTTIMVRHDGAAISLVWATNAFQDRWDSLRGEHG